MASRNERSHYPGYAELMHVMKECEAGKQLVDQFEFA